MSTWKETCQMTQWAWRLHLPCVLHPKPKAALLRRAAVTQASLWSRGKWSDWSNTGTWTPTGGVLLQPHISGRALAQAEAIIYGDLGSKNNINKGLGNAENKDVTLRLFQTHTYLCKKLLIFPNFFFLTGLRLQAQLQRKTHLTYIYTLRTGIRKRPERQNGIVASSWINTWGKQTWGLCQPTQGWPGCS